MRNYHDTIFAIFLLQLLTQICLALAALVLCAVEHKKPIEQLFSSLQELQLQDNGDIAVLEMLTVLPEEVIEDQYKNNKLSSSSRWKFGQEVCNCLRFFVPDFLDMGVHFLHL